MFQQALMSMTLSGVPKYGLFYYPDLSSLLLSADMYIVVKAGLYWTKLNVSFHMFLLSLLSH